MNKQFFALFVAACILSTAAHADITESFGSGANQFNMIFVPISNPGNAADTTGNPNPAGSVGYNYNIGKFEVSRDMINKANAEGNLGITLADMTSFGGNGANRPATGVSWNEAARYVNWLNSSQGFTPAYKFAVQPGQSGYSPNSYIELWQSTDAGYDATNPFRNSQAKYFLPSMNEWYKSAYYDPNANGGVGRYWNYPTGSDSMPTEVSGGTAAGTAVYGQNSNGGVGPADIDNAGGLSPYGVMGLGGNISEWQETEGDLLNNSPFSGRILRGGSWSGWLDLYALVRGTALPNSEFREYGFRVASIGGPPPEATIATTHVIHSNWSGAGLPIDSSKSLALEGLGLGTLSFSNLLNTSAGITGVLIDIKNLENPTALNLQDFRFQWSPQGSFSEILNPPISWQDASNPTEISVSPHPTDSNTSRVLIRWSSSQIVNRWLRLTIEATNNTGLYARQTYYLGQLLGETTGADGSSFTVSFADITPIRQVVGSQVDASNTVDINKDGIVSFADITAMRSNVGTVLTRITVP